MERTDTKFTVTELEERNNLYREYIEMAKEENQLLKENKGIMEEIVDLESRLVRIKEKGNIVSEINKAFS